MQAELEEKKVRSITHFAFLNIVILCVTMLMPNSLGTYVSTGDAFQDALKAYGQMTEDFDNLKRENSKITAE